MDMFSLVVNSGRSGSTFLGKILEENYGADAYIAHEDIPAEISRPRLFNRAYEPERIARILADDQIGPYLNRWKEVVSERPVIESGWTAYHLLPVLHHLFEEKFRYVILHRDPISFALSRASMGNYHPFSFYVPVHEVSPFDSTSIAPQYKALWPTMNHFEKCMYWWYVVYREAYEFRKRHPEVPCLEIASKDVFSGKGMRRLIEHFGLDYTSLKTVDVTKNELSRFCLETFPIGDEWKSFSRHEEILRFAETLGYNFDEKEIECRAEKYRLPKGAGPRVRHALGYWRRKAQLKTAIKKIFGR